MNRELAKKKAMSRDCHCVKGKDRDNNYNSIIDEIFDWHESEVKKLSIPVVSQQRELLIDGFDFINIHDGDRVKIGKLVDLVLKSINCG